MEAALVARLLKLAGGKLVPLISSGFASLMGVKKDLRELQRLSGEITSRLSAVGDKVTDSDPSFDWVKDLKDVAYDFDDLLYHLEAEKHKADVDGDKHVMAVRILAKPKSALSRLEMARRIKKIKKRFAKIVEQRNDVNTIANSLAAEHPIQHINETTGEMSILMNIDEKKVLGRDKVKHEIVSKLVEADTREISIVSIVGLGGSGKTTLAKYICQDNKIKEHFDVTWRVHVSREFDVEMLIGKLFESVSTETEKKWELYNLQHMIRTISKKMSGKKFLLVLDDIWNEDQHKWEKFEQHFNSGAPGSKILLTTRDRKVAEAVRSTDIVNLESLSDDDSWKLFQQSSRRAEEDLDSEFIEVGKEIVKKCAGMPLAIKSLGFVAGKREVKQWQSLRDSNLWSDGDKKDPVLGCLRLSYFHLSDDLKQCVLLCSIFPKGYSIKKDHLISQWIAHGFVNPMNEGRRSEDIGSDYFDSLLKVSFLQDLVQDGDILRCRMHDLVHDLTQQILQDEIVLIPKETPTDQNQRCRYLSIASCAEKVEKVDRKLFNKVRALYVTGGIFATDKPIKKGRCVRSVILEDINSSSLHMFVLKFEYLGYLRISGVDCTELPRAISDCWNLQALHITGCHRFAMLPESIGKLKKLRTLELSSAHHLELLPQSLGDCHSLESLHLICCRRFREIPHSIAKNGKLRVLNIVDCRQLPSESFAMPQNLWTINFSGCSFAVLPQCITSLSNLEHLDLGCCQELVELPEGIVNLKRLNVLNLEGCCKLRGLPTGFGQLTRLRKLGWFVIGHRSEHARISELGNLDMISGVLAIKGVENVKDSDDAEKAFLKKKNNVQTMILDWFGTSIRTVLNGLEPPSRIKTSAEDEVDMEVEQELAVLNGLEPPSRIENLEIHNYQGLHLPCWMTMERHSSSLDRKFKQTVDVPYFHHLANMELACFPRMKHLSGLVGLPSLKTLTLREFDALESISSGPLPSLTKLNIFRMPHLLELSATTRIALADEDGLIVCGNQEVQCFPRLSTIDIWNCPKLNGKLWCLASLESLRLRRCNEQMLFPVQPHGDESESPPSCSNSDGVSSCLSLLKELVLEGMTGRFCSRDELRQLPESMRSLTSLQSLQISSCSGLRGLPEWLGELVSLQSLEIFDCEHLRQFPEGIQHLTSLKNLHIEGCRALHQPSEGLGGLRSLQSLEISYCENLRQFPELGGLRSLRRLCIRELPALSCLPESMRGLISLEHLEIHSCHALHQLPDQIGELRSLQSLQMSYLSALTCLPESMERLTSLHDLFILSCSALTVLPESIGQLSALQSLQILSCNGLASLPRSIQCVTSLRELGIVGKPDLARRYKQGEGEDWHLISHIPNVEISVI